MIFKVRNRTQDQWIAEHVEKAESFSSRLVGLLGRDQLAHGQGLWIDRCNCIHTFFMKFAIDAIFLSRELRVVKTLRDIAPFRISPWVFGARTVLELPAGTLNRVSAAVGDELAFEAA